MLQVSAKLSISKVHGIGLFADQDIKEGQVIWRYHKLTTQVFSPGEFYQICSKIPLNSIKDMINYSYLKNHKVFYINDNTKFINHSLHANVCFNGETEEVATRDIKAGEEILENYFISYDRDDFFCKSLLFDLNSKKEILKLLGRFCVDDQNLLRQLNS